MIRVDPVLNATNTMKWPSSVSFLAVNQWMTELRAMPYHYSAHWQTPTEVSFAQASDCKGKAVTLYAQMRSGGAKNVRIVIGKHHLYDSATHAWLEWQTTGGSYTLDPTFNETPIKTTELDPMTYLALYAYDGFHKYRVSNAGFLPPTTRVATGKNYRFDASSTNATTFARPEFTGRGSGQFASATTQYLGVQPANGQRYHVSTRPTAAASRRGVMRSVRQHSVASGNRRKHRASNAQRPRGNVFAPTLMLMPSKWHREVFSS